MKTLTTLSLIATSLLSAGAVSAQRIQWNQVTPGNMEWSGKPSQQDTTIYNQVGPLTFGSDGGRAYTPSSATGPQDGDILVQPNGNRGVFRGGTYMEFDPSGRHVRNCFKQPDGRTYCVNF